MTDQEKIASLEAEVEALKGMIDFLSFQSGNIQSKKKMSQLANRCTNDYRKNKKLSLTTIHILKFIGIRDANLVMKEFIHPPMGLLEELANHGMTKADHFFETYCYRSEVGDVTPENIEKLYDMGYRPGRVTFSTLLENEQYEILRTLLKKSGKGYGIGYYLKEVDYPRLEPILYLIENYPLKGNELSEYIWTNEPDEEVIRILTQRGQVIDKKLIKENFSTFLGHPVGNWIELYTVLIQNKQITVDELLDEVNTKQDLNALRYALNK